MCIEFLIQVLNTRTRMYFCPVEMVCMMHVALTKTWGHANSNILTLDLVTNARLLE